MVGKSELAPKDMFGFNGLVVRREPSFASQEVGGESGDGLPLDRDICRAIDVNSDDVPLSAFLTDESITTNTAIAFTDSFQVFRHYDN